MKAKVHIVRNAGKRPEIPNHGRPIHRMAAILFDGKGIDAVFGGTCRHMAELQFPLQDGGIRRTRGRLGDDIYSIRTIVGHLGPVSKFKFRPSHPAGTNKGVVDHGKVRPSGPGKPGSGSQVRTCQSELGDEGDGSIAPYKTSSKSTVNPVYVLLKCQHKI